MSFCLNLNKRPLRQTLSNAFDTSQKTIHENMLLSKTVHMKDVKWNWNTVWRCNKKPDWYLYKRLLSIRILHTFLKQSLVVFQYSSKVQLVYNKRVEICSFLKNRNNIRKFAYTRNIPSSKDLFIKMRRGFETVFDTFLSILWLMLLFIM